jgi:hypothetical protein
MMVKAKKLVVDVKTGKQWDEEYDFTPPAPAPAPTTVNLEDLAKLLEYAKRQGWI